MMEIHLWLNVPYALFIAKMEVHHNKKAYNYRKCLYDGNPLLRKSLVYAIRDDFEIPIMRIFCLNEPYIKCVVGAHTNGSSI